MRRERLRFEPSEEQLASARSAAHFVVQNGREVACITCRALVEDGSDTGLRNLQKGRGNPVRCYWYFEHRQARRRANAWKSWGTAF